MLIARLQEAALLKRLLDSIKELATDANFKCNEEGIHLQMDKSDVALVDVKLDATRFEQYHCDRPMSVGVNLGSLTKVLQFAKDDDICTIKATDDDDILTFVYEAKKDSRRIAKYDMKLMDIDAETFGIPDTEYDTCITMTAAEFTRIVEDLSQLGESVRIEVSKEGVCFASEGEAVNGSILLKQTEAAREKKTGKEKVKKEVKEHVEMDDEEQDDEEQDDEEQVDEVQVDEEQDDTADGGVTIKMKQHVSLTFSLKYLVNFSKSSTLSNTVQLMMSNDVPLLVSYKFGQGEINYYLTPKIDEE